MLGVPARKVGRRVALTAILAAATGTVVSVRNDVTARRAAGRLFAEAGDGVTAPSGAATESMMTPAANRALSRQVPAASADAVAESFVGRRPPLAARSIDWSRIRSRPAYAWAVGSGWTESLRSLPHGPLAGRMVLPRGGRQIFPRFRLVGFCGLPGAVALGRLGVGSLPERVREIEQMATRYTVDRPPLPVLELIATVVQSSPGRDGRYRVRVDEPVIRQHLGVARDAGALLLLNIQPGRARFLDEVKVFEPWLREPDVGIALDPEWAVGPGEVPGRVFGHTTGSELDAVAGYLAGLVTADDLPEKVMVVHQLALPIIREEHALRRRPGVVVVKSVDGIGTAPAKVDTWNRLVGGMSSAMHPGFKLFFDEDTKGGSPLMTPEQVLSLTPTPEYVMYE